MVILGPVSYPDGGLYRVRALSHGMDQPTGRSPNACPDFSSLDFDTLWAGRDTTNQVERQLVRQLLPVVKGGRVLELGTGEGRLTDLLQFPNMEYVGLDLEARFLARVAARRGTKPARRYVLANILHLPFKDSTFSGGLMFRVFNFLPDLRAGLAEAFRVLTAGGTLLLSHNPRPSWATLVDDVSLALQPAPPRDRGLLTFGRTASAPVLRSNFPTVALTRRSFALHAESVGFRIVAERPSGLEDYRLARRLPPRLFVALSSALSRMGGFPTRVVALSKPGPLNLPLDPLDSILACPQCRGPLPPTTWDAPHRCPTCGFLPRWERGQLDLRWPRPTRSGGKDPFIHEGVPPNPPFPGSDGDRP
jgi:SAM-dependent methyltransferase